MYAKRFVDLNKSKDRIKVLKQHKEKIMRKYGQIYKILDDLLNNNGKDSEYEYGELDARLTYGENGEIHITPLSNDEFDERDEQEVMHISNDGSIYMTTGPIEDGKASGTIQINGEPNEEFLISLEDFVGDNRYDFGCLKFNDTEEQQISEDLYNKVHSAEDIIKEALKIAENNAESYIARKSYKNLLNLHVRLTNILKRRTTQITTDYLHENKALSEEVQNTYVQE